MNSNTRPTDASMLGIANKSYKMRTQQIFHYLTQVINIAFLNDACV